MIKLIRTDATNQDFINLVKQLDAELAIRDGDEHSFYDQYNGITQIKFAIVVYEDNKPVGCGAIKEFSQEAMEIKRMFILLDLRAKGLASWILKALERWALDLGYSKCILETGKKQPEAIALYKKNAYYQISNYGQYVGVDNSLCFEKNLLKQI